MSRSFPSGWLAVLLLISACGDDDDGAADRDAAPVDAGAPDASPMGPLELAIACTDTLADVAVTPAGLPPMTPALRGAVVRCAVEATLDQAAVDARLAASGIPGLPAAATGVTVLQIAYRTEMGPGQPAIATARVYLPTAPPPGLLPVILFAHGLFGLADACAQTPLGDEVDPLLSTNAVLLPLAARGRPVIAHDDAGLGTDGDGAVLDLVHLGQSTLDADRALRNLVTPGRLSSQTVFIGHSLGGRAVLAAQALAADYDGGASTGTVVAVVAVAPAWNLFKATADSFRNPAASTSASFAAYRDAWAMGEALYAYFAHDPAASGPGDGFPAATRVALTDAISTKCGILDGFMGIASAAPTFGELYDEPFRAAFVACLDGGACTGAAQAFHDQDLPPGFSFDPAGARVLLWYGSNDTLVDPALGTCTAEQLAAASVPTQLCVDPMGNHASVLTRNLAAMMDWIDAVLAGETPPTCDGSGLPACP